MSYYVCYGSWQSADHNSPYSPGAFYDYTLPICTISAENIRYVQGKPWFLPHPTNRNLILGWYGAGYKAATDEGLLAPAAYNQTSDSAYYSWLEAGLGWVVISLNSPFLADKNTGEWIKTC